MLGQPKGRRLDEPVRASLEEFVSPNHHYRHLGRSRDLSFDRDLLRGACAGIGSPSLDPVVFFTRQMNLVVEGLRSERQLLRVVADRLCFR
jgi:hypothetical protein